MAPNAPPSGKLLKAVNDEPFRVPPTEPVKAAMMMMSDAEPLPVIVTPKLFPVIRPVVVPTEELVGPCPMMRTVLGVL